MWLMVQFSILPWSGLLCTKYNRKDLISLVVSIRMSVCPSTREYPPGVLGTCGVWTDWCGAKLTGNWPLSSRELTTAFMGLNYNLFRLAPHPLQTCTITVGRSRPLCTPLRGWPLMIWGKAGCPQTFGHAGKGQKYPKSDCKRADQAREKG